ncbi:hypothetical protein [Terrisporobacter sp.]|uniref:hypothetical protein n=1 Tax=Terrisporobacter sp. TaxID=1965305 RepID=UPI00261B9D8A|nr:hypothetical protein [Terrisporobacter sp.]
MKNIGLLLSSVTAFFIILGCLFYNSLLIDMKEIKDYVTESNLILEEVVKKEDKVDDKKGEYISRLLGIKNGMENANTSILLKKYKDMKMSSIELLVEAVSESNENDRKDLLNQIYYSNGESQKELNTLMNKNFIEVTYLCIKSYISV